MTCRQSQIVVAHGQHCAWLDGHLRTLPVVALLPFKRTACLFVEHHIFILKGTLQSVGIKREYPFVGPATLHAHSLCSPPATQCGQTAHQCQHLSGAKLWCQHTEHYGTSVIDKARRSGSERRYAMCVGRTVEVAFSGNVAPVVGKHEVRFLASAREVARHGIPLTAHHLAVLDHYIYILERAHITREHSKMSLPVLTVFGA